MSKSFHAGALAVGVAVLVTGAAFAQQDQPQAAAANQPAAQCLADLEQFNRTLSEDQFWVRGWGQSWGYGVGAHPPAGTVEPGAGIAAAPAGTPGLSPWGANGAGAMGAQSPRFQVRALYEAAYVLGQRGSQEGCEYLLAQLEDTYDAYVTRLEEAGVNPDEVSTWRQEQLALGQPVSEVEAMGRITVDDITGSDVRNTSDEYLGSVSDVAFDARSGAITYVIVARGGFLGIGEDHVAVPWTMFRATPGFNTLVLDVPEATLDQAPTVDPNTFADSSTITTQDRQVDSYWEEKS